MTIQGQMKALSFIGIMVVLLFAFASTTSSSLTCLTHLSPITPDNAAQITTLERLGFGFPSDIAWWGDQWALSNNHGVALLSSASGEVLDRLYPSISHGTNTVEFSPDGALIAAGSGSLPVGDGRTFPAYVWEAGNLITIFDQHQNLVEDLAFTPDGSMLATAGRDAIDVVRFWNPHNGVQSWQIDGATSPLAIEGDYIAVRRGEDIELWNINQQRFAMVMPQEARTIHDVDISGDYVIVLTETPDRNVQVWNLQTGNREMMYPGWRALAVHGSQVAYFTEDGVVRVHDTLQPDDYRESPQAFRGLIFSLTFDPTGQALGIARQDGALYRWDLADDSVTELSSGGYLRINTLHIDGSGCRVLVGTTNQTQWLFDASARLWNLDTLREERLSDDNRDLKTVVPFFRRDGSVDIYATTAAAAVHLERGEEATPLSGFDVVEIEVSPDDRTLAGLARNKDWLIIYDIVKNTILHEIGPFNPGIAAIAFTSDASTLAYTDRAGVLNLLNIETGISQMLTPAPDTCQNGCYLAFSQDGSRLAIGIRNIYILDVGHDEIVATLPGELDLSGLTWNSAGTLLAASAFGTLTMWDTVAYEALAEFPDLQIRVGKFTPDDRMLILQSGSAIAIMGVD